MQIPSSCRWEVFVPNSVEEWNRKHTIISFHKDGIWKNNIREEKGMKRGRSKWDLSLSSDEAGNMIRIDVLKEEITEQTESDWMNEFSSSFVHWVITAVGDGGRIEKDEKWL